jgi:hypothetical protein
VLFRRLFVITCLVVGLVVGSLGSAHAATSPDAWAPKFCKALKQWQATVTSESNTANTALGKATGGDLASIRGEFVRFLGKDVAATQAAIRSIKKAGAPSSANGSKIQSKVIAAFQSASDVFAEAKASAANLSTTDATSFVTDATKIQQDLNGASDAFQTNFTTVQKLDSKGEIGQAITSAKACKFLTG